jgi:hypothetical protein
MAGNLVLSNCLKAEYKTEIETRQARPCYNGGRVQQTAAGYVALVFAPPLFYFCVLMETRCVPTAEPFRYAQGNRLFWQCVL